MLNLCYSNITADIKQHKQEIHCIAKNIYFEARDQIKTGQVAVTQVVFNRVLDDRFPNNICEVIQQGPTYAWNPELPIRHKCQFSWYCDGKSDLPTEKLAWGRSLKLAQELHYIWVTGEYVDITDGSTNYHADYVFPNWGITKTMQIGDHIFYRWEN